MYSQFIISFAALSLFSQVYAGDLDHQAKKAAKKEAKEKALSTYKACDMQALMNDLQKNPSFQVSKPIQEKESFYYEVKDMRTAIFNTDLIRKNTCDYVMKNSCYVYWNNVMATAKIAAVELKSVIVSPPVNLLSPLTGCKTPA
jgi:hypothetical protein